MSALTVQDFVERLDGQLALLKRLVEIESPSTDKAAVDRAGAWVAEEARRLGAVVVLDKQTEAGDNVVARWGLGQPAAGDEERAGVLLLCHLDTVHEMGTLARLPCEAIDGKLMGPGTVDMKASVAIVLTALDALRETRQWPPWPVTALFTSDEELGSDYSRGLIETHARQAGLVLCMEPCLPDGSLKTWRKGVGDFEIVARGRAAHAGADHERGRNAIEELAHHVLAAQRLTDYSAGTTVNVGVINGGTRSNIVPEEARAKLDMRVKTVAEAERIAAWLQARQPVLAGTSLEVTGGLNRPPMPRDPVMIRTFEKARQIAATLGLKLTEGGTGGGSDANFVAPLGVPVLDGLGALGNGAHTDREHIVIASLPEKTALLAAIISNW
jgi:glutamate carboxypeptidase